MKKYKVHAIVETMRKTYDIEYEEVILSDNLTFNGVEATVIGLIYQDIKTKHKKDVFIKIIKLDIQGVKNLK